MKASIRRCSKKGWRPSVAWALTDGSRDLEVLTNGSCDLEVVVVGKEGSTRIEEKGGLPAVENECVTSPLPPPPGLVAGPGRSGQVAHI